MLRLSKNRKIGVIVLSVVVLASIGLTTFYMLNGNSFDTRSSAGSTTWKIGDLNGDSKVSMADFNIWLTGYRKFKKDGTYATVPDLDKDKKIAFKDFFLWLDAYREYKHSAGEEMKTISKTSDMGTFKLEYKYMDDHTWFYRITGKFSKASLCDRGSVNIAIAKNSDTVEVAKIYMNGTPLKEAQTGCTGSYTKEGEFTAASNVNISFVLKELDKISVSSYKTADVNYGFMTLTYEYKGSNTWSYAIKGDLPNSCFKVSPAISIINPSLTKSSENQADAAATVSSAAPYVYIYNDISPDKVGQTCTTAIQKYSKTGTFKAASNAKIDFISTPAYPAVGLVTDIVPVLTSQATHIGTNLWSYKVTGTFPSGCYSAKTVVHPVAATYVKGDPRCTTVGELTKCTLGSGALATQITLSTTITETSSSTGVCTQQVVNYSATDKFVASDLIAAEKLTFRSGISAVLK